MTHPCPFCQLDPQETGRVALENEHCLFLTGVEPVLQGSGVIIPRAHRPTPFDLTPAEWAATYDLLQQAKAMIERELRPDGFNLGWNCGEVAGQAIPHAHLHVIPRFHDEPYAGKGIRHWLKSEANLRPSMQPTPYVDINQFLSLLLQQQRLVLGANLVGAYLGGSLALGDFDPAASDIDLLVVTAVPVSVQELEQLRAMHSQLSGHKMGSHLEISYIPQAAIRRHDRSDCHHPSMGNTWAFGLSQHDEAWVIQRWIIREKGVTLWGPPPATLIDPLSEQDLRQAVRTLLREDWSNRLNTPEWFRRRDFQAYGILTMCRCRYTLETGAIASKPAAAAWAKERMPAWAHLIDRALRWRYDPQPDEVTESLDFIREVVNLSR